MTPDEVSINYARKRLDLSKNLNDQGYYGPTPNEADPRTARSEADEANLKAVEYYDWVEQWCQAHDYKFDNKQMLTDRRKYLHEKNPDWNGNTIW